VQDATPVGPVVRVAQVVVVKELPAVGPDAVHVATPVGPVVTVLHVVVMNVGLPVVPAVQVATGVGPVVAVVQVVAT
jgi:hypothetical protein